MKNKHTIVVEYPHGVSPRYSEDTAFPHGGRIASVDFDGDRLKLMGLLQEAAQEVFDKAADFEIGGISFSDFDENFEALSRLESVLERIEQA
ncbi:hypothetical protein R84981_003009 [Carnimonas sp. R-84981]|uniref:hypothetical protein n=1 Tax=Carnimonas bestiolae TaxID=3402172 RepID=UPI003EDB9768